MPQILYVGLVLALIGSPLLLAVFKRLGFDPFSLIPRLALWVIALLLLIVAAENVEAWRVHFGLQWPAWQALGLTMLATAILFIVLGVYTSLRSKFGAASPEQLELQQKLLRLPFNRRCFVVVTAAVTEEVLYRGYAIGVGQLLLGSLWLACIFSVAVFTLAHLRWGLAHLFPVFFCTVVITLLFVITQNLLTCMIVHAILDGLGVLVMPVIMKRKRAARAVG